MGESRDRIYFKIRTYSTNIRWKLFNNLRITVNSQFIIFFLLINVKGIEILIKEESMISI